MSNVANTILAQLGGNKFIAMTGAKDISSEKDALNFKLPKMAKNKSNFITIKLVNDEYTIKFFKYAKFDLTEISKFDNVQASDLTKVFERETGLATKL